MRIEAEVVPRDGPQDMTVQEMVAPFFLGAIVNYLLWGIQITQSYYYYKAYRKTDRRWTKISVFALVVVDAMQSVATSQQSWRFMVGGWGDLDGVLRAPGWGTYVLPLMDALTASVVHLFYASKIWRFLDTPHKYFGSGIVIALSCLQLAGAVGCAAVPFSFKAGLEEFSRHKVWACIWLSAATVTDIVITAIMTWKLSKSRTDYGKTNDMISKIIRGIVETGLATSLVQLVALINYIVFLKTRKPYFIFLGCMVSKVYSTSILALLNSRKPGKSGVLWESSQERTVDSIRIHATQTVNVTSDYMLKKKSNRDSKSTRLRTDSLIPPRPDTASTRSLPFQEMEHVKE